MVDNHTTKVPVHLTLVVFAARCLCEICVLGDEPSLSVDQVVAKHKAMLNLIHDLDVSANVYITRQNEDVYDPPRLEASARWLFSKDHGADRIVYTDKDFTSAKLNTTYNYYWKAGEGEKLYNQLAIVRDGVSREAPFCQVAAPLPSSTPKHFERDIAPYLMLYVTPAIPEDPRLSLSDIIALSPIAPELKAPALGGTVWTIEVSWPRNVPSSMYYNGRISIELDERYGFAISMIRSRMLFNYKSDDPNNDNGATGRFEVTQSVRDWKLIQGSGVYFPTEIERVIAGAGLDPGSESIAVNKKITVTDVKVNQLDMAASLGFEFPQDSVVHFLPSNDRTTTEKWAIWGPDNQPQIEFTDQAEMYNYIANRAVGSADGTAPVRVNKRRMSFLFWIVLGNVAVLSLLYIVYRRRNAANWGKQ